MRRSILVMVVGIAASLVGVRQVAAQDIVGLSMRPTEANPGAEGNGSLDITRSSGEGNYEVAVDMSGVAEGMDLAQHEGATAWVVWAVDMDGVRHNLGTLDEEMMLTAPVDYVVAKVYVTAEADPATTQPTGEPLFISTLRNVDEVDTVPAPAAAAPAEGTTAGSVQDTPKDAAPAAGEAAGAESAKPQALPTTGDPIQDTLLFLAVAAALLLLGWRLRSVRV